jgi:hypothetical protein
MRWIAALVLVLLVLTLAAAEMPLAAPQQRVAWTDWRRTVNGWEHPDWLPQPVRTSLLHPAAAGVLLLLLATASLVAFSSTD